MNIMSCVIMTGVLSVASYTDIRRGKIPNLLIIIGAGAGAYAGGYGFMLRFVLCMVFTVLISGLHICGAGDMKLASLMIGLCGVHDGVSILIWSLFFAAGISVILIIIKSRNLKSKFPMAPYMLIGYIAYSQLYGLL